LLRRFFAGQLGTFDAVRKGGVHTIISSGRRNFFVGIGTPSSVMWERGLGRFSIKIIGLCSFSMVLQKNFEEFMGMWNFSE